MVWVSVEMIPETDNAVEKIFSPKVSRTYELVNHVLTLGCDVLWRRRMARLAASGGGTEWADLCTGTGETAVYLRRLAPESTTVHAVDFSRAMMAEAMKKPEGQEIDFIVADVKALPFDDSSLDLITMSFATRNINLGRDVLTRTFAEYQRVLKPGGRFVNLETSQPPNRLVRTLMHTFVKGLVKPVGALLSGARPAYAYLSHTIPRFYPAEELATILGDAGFEKVTFKRLLCGAAAIHEAVR
jgi:demethylmenaquinone methyltransferase/2-methoxy-6-polyprenyl-1,4-benzoquinol methylase